MPNHYLACGFKLATGNCQLSALFKPREVLIFIVSENNFLIKFLRHARPQKPETLNGRWPMANGRWSKVKLVTCLF